jgi:hypothetical protein
MESFKEHNTSGYRKIYSAQNTKKNADPDYYNNEVKKLKVKVRKACNRIKSGQPAISRGTEATVTAVAISAGDIFDDY